MAYNYLYVHLSIYVKNIEFKSQTPYHCNHKMNVLSCWTKDKRNTIILKQQRQCN